MTCNLKEEALDRILWRRLCRAVPCRAVPYVKISFSAYSVILLYNSIVALYRCADYTTLKLNHAAYVVRSYELI